MLWLRTSGTETDRTKPGQVALNSLWQISEQSEQSYIPLPGGSEAVVDKIIYRSRFLRQQN